MDTEWTKYEQTVIRILLVWIVAYWVGPILATLVRILFNT